MPAFPLPAVAVMRWESEGKRRYQVRDDEATQARHERELALWEQVWTYPQACAWSMEPWRWPTVAMYVRTFVVCEGSDATAADKGSLHRFADQIALTPAGMRENGWAIAAVEVGAGAPPAAPSDGADGGSDPATGDEVGQRRTRRRMRD
ncbi:hypothetical protein [Nocardioides sp. Leaf374]|uniref:hypothetical protein n=1 Tax=Nocardioides sp. Leaf374 TaxID=2876560 RepID=UPI001E6068BB|nr:hypothetical protein [Nocardioides sp. Leaf374]